MKKISDYWRKKINKAKEESQKEPRSMEQIKEEHKALATTIGVKEYEARRIKQDLEVAYQRMSDVNQEAFDRMELDKNTDTADIISLEDNKPRG